MGLRLVPKSVTLNDLERRNGHYFALLADSEHLLAPFPSYGYTRLPVFAGLQHRPFSLSGHRPISNRVIHKIKIK